MYHHPQHGAAEQNDIGIEANQRRQGLTGAIAANAPTYAKERYASKQFAIQVIACMQEKLLGEKWLLLLEDEMKAGNSYTEARHHRQNQARVPVAGDIQKFDYFCWIGHARNRQTSTKQGA